MNAPALREALRRLLGLVPTLLVVSMVAFWGLSETLGTHDDSSDDEQLPIFFNRAPQGVAERAKAIALAIAQGQASQAQQQQLVYLGAAALPTLMPFLDSLPPQQRTQVAMALAPLATRMGIADDDDLQTPEAAAAFWNRFWLDRAIDFRPQVVERAVTRLVQRPSELRRTEVKQLDTYALPELMTAIKVTRDARSFSQLISVAAHITGLPWHTSPSANLQQIEAQAQQCLSWWVTERHNFANYAGIRRLVAMLQETRYGQWVINLIRPIHFDGAASGPKWSAFPTLVLIGAGLLGGYLLGPAVAAWTATLKRHRSIALAVSAALASLPAAAVAHWLSQTDAFRWALAAMLILGASLLCIYQYQAIRDACSYDFVLTHRAFGAPRLRAALRALHSSSIVSAAHLANHGASLFTAACVVEWAFEWHGVGWLTVTAVHARDVSTLASVAVIGTLFTGVLQITSGLLLSRFERSPYEAS